MFVIDRQHLFKFQSQIEIKKTTKFVKIRDIDNTLHENFEYVEMNFFILKRLSNENETIVHFMQKIHIVDDFRVNMLLKSNILDSKKTVKNNCLVGKRHGILLLLWMWGYILHE